MIDIEQKNFARMLSRKLVENPFVPAFRQILLRLEVFIEEALLVRDAEKVENVHDHVEMGKQKNLREIGREILFAGFNARPKFRLGMAQRFRVEFHQACPRFETFVDLIGFELADGDAPHETMKNIRTERLKDATHLHSRKG